MQGPHGGTGLARLSVCEEPGKAAVSRVGERAAGSGVERSVGHISPGLYPSSSGSNWKGIFSRGGTKFWFTFLNDSSGCSVEN